jgi:hypothetical protein
VDPDSGPDRPAEVGPVCVPASCPAPANADAFCKGESCAWTCRRGFHPAGDACAANDLISCCGDECAACAAPAHGAVSCAIRTCAITCDAGYHLAGNQCLLNDTPACCGPGCTACPTPAHAIAQCRNQGCAFDCAAGFHRSGTMCVEDSPACCGPECKVCTAPASATATCSAGSCGYACDAGYHRAGDGCAPNLGTDCCGPGCAMCAPTRTHAAAVCDGLACLDPSPCLTNFHDCNGACVSSLSTASCGASCLPCPARPNAAVSCNGVACVYACADGYGDCDGNPNNGCEANLKSDPANCGACATGATDSHVCATGGSHPQACHDGQCRCPDGWGDCNGDRNDGCEVSLKTSNVHCGACNPHNPSETDLLTEDTYNAAMAAPACRVYKLEVCVNGTCH